MKYSHYTAFMEDIDQYVYGCNWRAGVAMLVNITPTMPSLAKNVKPSIDIGGTLRIADSVGYYCFPECVLGVCYCQQGLAS